MSAPILDVAAEVVEVINDSNVLGTDILATRQFNPSVKLEGICKRRCIVYPARNASEDDLARGLTAHEYEIQILIQEKLCTPNTTEWTEHIETLTGVVDSVAQLFRGGVKLTDTESHVTGVEVDPVFVPDHLDRMNLFSSVISLIVLQARDST